MAIRAGLFRASCRASSGRARIESADRPIKADISRSTITPPDSHQKSLSDICRRIFLGHLRSLCALLCALNRKDPAEASEREGGDGGGRRGRKGRERKRRETKSRWSRREEVASRFVSAARLNIYDPLRGTEETQAFLKEATAALALRFREMPSSPPSPSSRIAWKTRAIRPIESVLPGSPGKRFSRRDKAILRSPGLIQRVAFRDTPRSGGISADAAQNAGLFCSFYV